MKTVNLNRHITSEGHLLMEFCHYRETCPQGSLSRNRNPDVFKDYVSCVPGLNASRVGKQKLTEKKQQKLHEYLFVIIHRIRKQYLTISTIFLFLVFVLSFAICPGAHAQDDMLKLVEKKQTELKDKESFLKQEEKRLEALKKDVDERIEKYTKILTQIENLLKKIEQVKEQNFEHIVKTYETMPPDEAAQRLSSLDEELLVKIILNMKPKKAAAIMALMDTKKAASITQSIGSIEKKFPTR